VELLDGIPYQEVEDAHNACGNKTATPTPRQVELEDIRGDYKRAGFGLLYGETEFKLATQLHKFPDWCMDEDDKLEHARQLQQKWLDQYPAIRDYIRHTEAWLMNTGYVSTILGWRRYLPTGKLLHPKNLHETEWQMRSKEFKAAMRAGINATIQGSAADLMKLIQIRVWKDPMLAQMPFVVQSQVHDELVAVVRAEYADAALARCLELATNPLEDVGIHLPVDILADGGIGRTWKEAK
jgi:DNA polymerase-1